MRAATTSLALLSLSGCYIVPVAPDGTPLYPAVPVPAPIVAPAYSQAPSAQYAPSGPPAPIALQARLYPSNEAAARVGMLAGSVTNMMNGKGRFQLDYRGEMLVGEATRVPGDDRRGVANAYGERGTYMTCQYRMSTPSLGTGTCDLSNGASYQVHLGG